MRGSSDRRAANTQPAVPLNAVKPHIRALQFANIFTSTDDNDVKVDPLRNSLACTILYDRADLAQRCEKGMPLRTQESDKQDPEKTSVKHH